MHCNNELFILISYALDILVQFSFHCPIEINICLKLNNDEVVVKVLSICMQQQCIITKLKMFMHIRIFTNLMKGMELKWKFLPFTKYDNKHYTTYILYVYLFAALSLSMHNHPQSSNNKLFIAKFDSESLLKISSIIILKFDNV